MPQFGGKDSKRHFTVVMGGKEHGLYVSSTPSSAARKAVTKLCTANKSKKVEFHIREITQGSKKKTYGPYDGYIEKLKEPIELKGRVIRYKPVAKLSGKVSVKKGGNGSDANNSVFYRFNELSNIPLGRNNAPYPEPSNREIQKIKQHERKEHMHAVMENIAERKNKEKINKRIIHNLNDIAYKLEQDKKIINYEYFGPTKEYPVFFVLYTEAGRNPLPKYFLTCIKGYYVAFHVTNPESDNRGDVFAGITEDFEKFKDEVLDENFKVFKKKFFYEYHGMSPNARLSVYNKTQTSSIHYLIILKRINGKIHPTYEIEKIETSGNNSSTSLFP
jgi:hypothetical protein